MSRWLFYCASLTIFALLSHALVNPVCDGHQCLGPVILKFTSNKLCASAPSFGEILPSEVANGAQGSCLNVKGPVGDIQESRRWACSKMGLDIAFYASPDCDLLRYQVPYKTESYTIDRCFPTLDNSFAFSCSNSSTDLLLAPVEPITSPLPVEPLGKPYVDCPRGICPPNVPYISTYHYSQCNGPSVQHTAIFENTTASNTVCYKTSRPSLSDAPLFLRYGCTRTEIFARYYTNGCPQSEVAKPVFTISFPLLDACIFDQESQMYFKYVCS